MIELIQHKVTNSELSNNINKIEEIEVNIDKNMVEHDINRLKKELDKSTNRYDKANIKALIKYLEKLLKNTNEDGVLEICWNNSKDGIPVTYPIKIINEQLYKVDISNYVATASNENIICIDLTELADIIAFEFIFKELGETHDSIEGLLDKCGILSFEDSSILTNRFKENNDKMFELSKDMKVSDTPYMSSEDYELHDYFHTKKFKVNTYKEVVEYSCRYAATLIANNILNNLNTNNINYKLLAINSTNIVFIIDKLENKEDYQSFIDEVSIRVFGRRFIVNTKVEVY